MSLSPKHSSTSEVVGDLVGDLVAALRRGDRDGAMCVLTRPGFVASAAVLEPVADMLMRRRRWDDAAWLFGRIPDLGAASALKGCLSRNLAALERRRPELYAQLVALPAQRDFGIAAAATGRPTLFYRRPDGSTACLSPGQDSVAAAVASMARLGGAANKGQSLALCGLGDGYLLQLLAQNPPALFMDMQQAAFVLEPEPQIVLHALMIHDYTGPAGPIEQERFQWFVGPEWAEGFEAALLGDLMLPCPSTTVGQGMDAARIAARIQSSAQKLIDRDGSCAEAIERHYAGLDAGALAALFAPAPPRPPRVLLVTTRFSTVLQYSTRGTADAFERLGWETRVLIEPRPHHRILRTAMRQATAEFKPDLVFQIDHLRAEHGDMFPPALPFVCWAQDHLPNLTSTAAAASVGPRDFVLVGMPTMYVNRYKYPRRQTLMLAKLTRIPQRPTQWKSDGDDLVYVSSASARPADVAAQILARLGSDSAAGRHLVQTCCRRTIEHYGNGGTLPAVHHARELIAAVEAEVGVRVQDPETARRLADALFDGLGNVLYRQQGLAWAARVAERHGLTLAVYGPGWDAHPQFALFARGPVAYGAELEALTRRSKINFALEPFFSVSHQRLVDGLVAGGFFLARHHPNNTIIQEVSNFLGRRVPPSVTTAVEARARMSPEDREAFDRIAERFGTLTEFADPVEFVRTSERASLVRPGDDEPIPGLRSITFADADGLEARVLRFVGDPVLRAQVAARQRDTMESRRSYFAGIGRIVNEVRDLLEKEARAHHAESARCESREATPDETWVRAA